MAFQKLFNELLRREPRGERGCKDLEIVIDHTGTKVWINVDNGCAGRWYNIGRLHIDDRRGTTRDESR